MGEPVKADICFLCKANIPRFHGRDDASGKLGEVVRVHRNPLTCVTNLRESHAHLTAQVERLRALVPQWRPIETAPKDGTWVLLWWPELSSQPRQGHQWKSLWYDIGSGVQPTTPTHWQPLPEPPAPATHIPFRSEAERDAWDETQGQQGESGEGES